MYVNKPSLGNPILALMGLAVILRELGWADIIRLGQPNTYTDGPSCDSWGVEMG